VQLKVLAVLAALAVLATFLLREQGVVVALLARVFFCFSCLLEKTSSTLFVPSWLLGLTTLCLSV